MYFPSGVSPSAMKTGDLRNPSDAQPVPIHCFDVHKYLPGNHWQHLLVRVCYHIFHFQGGTLFNAVFGTLFYSAIYKIGIISFFRFIFGVFLQLF